jgi:hypothetical protein
MRFVPEAEWTSVMLQEYRLIEAWIDNPRWVAKRMFKGMGVFLWVDAVFNHSSFSIMIVAFFF